MNAPEQVEAGGLRAIIEAAAEDEQTSLADLTVMSALTDPYRLDVPAKHRDAAWIANAWRQSGARQGIHLRGLHYVFVSVSPALVLPDGTLYLNTAEHWIWLQQAAGYARWLGYIPFEAIVDERNLPPIIATEGVYAPFVTVTRLHESARCTPFNDLLPRPILEDMAVRQAYRLVLIGEKQSLAEVLRPIAQQYHAELVLPTGELSTTLLYGIVKRAYDDGRPCRVFYLSDFDPTGYHMPVEVSRKVQALLDLQFSGLDIQVRRCALTAEQVRELELPSTPLKETERRADRWRERWGVEQTEIDALATLRPRELRQIVRDDLDPYFDHSLSARVSNAAHDAYQEIQDIIDRHLEPHASALEDLRNQYGRAVDALVEANIAARPIIERAHQDIEVEVDSFEPDLPEPEVDGDVDEPLFSSSDEWTTATRKLLEAKL